MNSLERARATYELKPVDRVPTTELCVNHPVASKLLGRDAITGFGGYIRGKVHNTMLLEGRRDEWAERFTRDTLDINRALDFDIFQFHDMPAKGEKPNLREVAENVWRSENGDGRFWVQKWDPGTDFYGEIDASFDHDPERELKLMIEELKRDPIRHWKPGEDEFFRTARKEFPDHFLWGGAGFWFPYSETGITSLIEFPDLWREYNELLCEKNKTSVDLQLAAGADAFWCGSDWAFKNGPMMSEATFREVFFESYKELVKYIHSKGVKFIHHTDGNIERWEKMWFGEIGMDGYHAIEPSAGMDIIAVRKRWPKLILHGNLDCGNLLTLGTPAQIEDEVIRLVQGLAPASGWVFSSSNSIHSNVPVENVMAMTKAIKTHGVYPIGPKQKLFK